MAAPPARARADYDYLIKLLLIGDSGNAFFLFSVFNAFTVILISSIVDVLVSSRIVWFVKCLWHYVLIRGSGAKCEVFAFNLIFFVYGRVLFDSIFIYNWSLYLIWFTIEVGASKLKQDIQKWASFRLWAESFLPPFSSFLLGKCKLFNIPFYV